MKSVFAATATAIALTLSTSAFAVTNEAGEAEAVGASKPRRQASVQT